MPVSKKGLEILQPLTEYPFCHMYIHNLKEITIIIIFECIKIGIENSIVCVSADLKKGYCRAL
jgi:hypothetical protein